MTVSDGSMEVPIWRSKPVVPVAGAALALIGCFLPWVSTQGISVTGWQVPMRSLLLHKEGTSVYNPGIAIALVLAYLVLLLVLGNFLPGWAYIVLGAFVAGLGAAGVQLVMQAHLPIGVGALCTIAGGIAITSEFLLVPRRSG